MVIANYDVLQENYLAMTRIILISHEKLCTILFIMLMLASGGELGHNRCMGQVLYRKYRSRTLEELVGQEHITEALSTAIKAGKFSHAYLFVGPRGVGKTSVARIFAHAVNEFAYTGENYVDIIEIDAASNTGVDAIRDLIDAVGMLPMVGKKKIYIIDEVHMLSKSAFNALLKTLEEPPEHIMFILATTDAHKIPKTILSRVQTFAFRLITPKMVAEHLRYIADQEKIEVTNEALKIIAEQGGGSFRDSISLLDQVSSIDKRTTAATLQKRLGLATDEAVLIVLQSFKARDLVKIVETVNMVISNGAEPQVLAGQIIDKILDSPEYYSDTELLKMVDKLSDVSGSAHPKARLVVALCPEKMPKAAQELKEVLGTTVADQEAPVEKKWKSSRKTVQKSVEKLKKDVEKAVEKPGEKVELSWSRLLNELLGVGAKGYQAILVGAIYEENTDGSITVRVKNDFELGQLRSIQFEQVLRKVAERGFVVPRLEITDERQTTTGEADIDAALLHLGGGEVVEVL